MALSRPPKAFWPLTVTAGVNDYVDLTIEGTTYAPRLTAGVYYSAAALATDLLAKLVAAYTPTPVVTVPADKTAIEWLENGTPTATIITPGSYTVLGLAQELAYKMELASGGLAYYAGTIGTGGKIRIQSLLPASTWKPTYLTDPNSAWPVAGWTVEPSAAQTLTADTLPSTPGTAAWAVSVSSAGRVTIGIGAGAPFSILFSTGTHAATSARDILGFGAVDTASGTTHTGTLQHQSGWYPERPCVFDSREEYERVAAGTVALSGAIKSVVYGSPQETRRVDFAWLPEWKTKIAREGTHTNEALERLWRDGYARFRYWPDATVEGTYIDVALDGEALKRFSPGRDDKMQLYAYTLSMRKFV